MEKTDYWTIIIALLFILVNCFFYGRIQEKTSDLKTVLDTIVDYQQTLTDCQQQLSVYKDLVDGGPNATNKNMFKKKNAGR